MMQVAAQYQPILRELGIDADAIFSHKLIKPWRKLEDRENCTLDAKLQDGRSMRWHIKRYPTPTAMEDEVRGHQLLVESQIPTADLVAWGKLQDQRSFVIFDDLTGYRPADKLIESGTSFEPLLIPTADLSIKLHSVELHHRDLYLCHFFIKLDGETVDVRLIDTARVKRLPKLFTRTRWIVKDLSQFWYSTLKHPITDEQRQRWLDRYGANPSLRRKIERKAAWIGRHDQRLRRDQPHRNISIPVK